MKPNKPTVNNSLNTQARSFARFTTTAVGMCAAMFMLSQSIAADARDLSKADTKFVEQEAAISMNSMRLGELAVKKSPNPEVKAFAEEEVIDRKNANEEITTFASTRNVEIVEIKSDDNVRAYTKLDKAASEDFDKEYLDAVVKQNERSVKDFEKLSENSDTDSDLKAWADKMLVTMRTRLARAEALRTSLNEESTSASVTF